MKFKKIRTYDVTVEGEKVTNITGIKGGNYVTLHPYKWDKRLNCMVRQDNLSFNQLKNGIYKGSIEMR